MDIRIALDGSRHRNLSLVVGDEMTFNVMVYAQDIDPMPIPNELVTNVVFRLAGPASQTILTGTPFVVPASMGPRNAYSIQATVGGVRMTIAYGLIEMHGAIFYNGSLSCTDYGWVWPYYGIAPWP